ncbi:hypothetical protein HDU98_007681 [Podochytrium sp. JEL0797]|nr:hypothetical protein HDU98_007681 [Podochytrium sp. JEL0797]
MDMEIQARAVEFSAISQLELDVKFGLLERMPVLEIAVKEEEVKGTGENLVTESLRNSTVSLTAATRKSGTQPVVSAVQDLLDLNFDMTPSTTNNASVPSNHLAELFGGISLVPTAVTNGSTPTAPIGTDILSNLFSGNTPAPNPLAGLDPFSNSAPPASAAIPEQSRRLCFEKANLKIYLAPLRSADGKTVDITATFENGGFSAVTNLSFQVAVPKSLRLQINPPSSTFIPPAGSATQTMRIENPSMAVVKLRLKIGFMAGNEGIDEIAECSGL